MRVRFNDEMACSVYQHNQDISVHQGKYIDLKLHPERAHELPEANDWPALGDFVEAINRCDDFRTCGCTASGQTPGGHEAPFVDIAFEDSILRVSYSAIGELIEEFLLLDSEDVNDEFVLELCYSDATLPDGQNIVSLRLWMLGAQQLAEQAFQPIVTLLGHQDVSEYLPAARQEQESAKAQQRQERFRRRKFISVWILLAAAMFGLIYWLFGIPGIGGFAIGLVSCPLLAWLWFVYCM